MPLLEIKHLTIHFDVSAQVVCAVDEVCLSVNSGETVCLVGESGSGKTVTALSVARLLPCPPARYAGGQILLAGRKVFELDAAGLHAIRGRVVSYVFQEPGAALNPILRIGGQIKESLRLHRPRDATDGEVVRLLKLVGIPAAESRIVDYPHQLSGGMQQRVMIAMALASQPQLLIADEPTTALDATIQAQILELLRDLKQKLGMSILLITHNLGLVAEFADRVAVMYAGQIVESAPAKELLERPRHPYTRALLNSVPKLGEGNARLTAIPGSVPPMGRFPSGCRFHPRCSIARPDCRQNPPAMLETEPGRWVRCPYGTSSELSEK